MKFNKREVKARIFAALIFEQKLTRDHYHWLLVNFALLFLPLVGNVPTPFLIAGFAALGYKTAEVYGRVRSIPAWALALFSLASAGATYASYGTLLGYEAGTAFLLLLAGLKVLEVKSYRDLMITLLLCYFLLTGSLLFNQGIGITIFLFTSVLAVTVTMIRMHVTDLETLKIGDLLKRSLQLVVYATPVFVGLFIVFPRFSSPITFQTQSTKNTTGFDDELNPGQVSQLAQSDELAFRALVGNNQLPDMQTRYWRGTVLAKSQGMKWSKRSSSRAADSEPLANSEDAIQMDVIIEPRFGRFLFALDQAQQVQMLQDGKNALRRLDGAFEFYRDLNVRTRYRTVSLLRPGLADGSLEKFPQETLTPEERTLLLKVDAPKSKRIEELLARINSKANKPEAKVQLLLEQFRNFSYNLEPQMLSGDQLDIFVFETKQGFCEHFAASFATMARWLKIPSRVIVGFHGGTMNDLAGEASRYVTVRSFDAHAWAEVYMDERGWVRVDPTAYVMPMRLLAGAEKFLKYGAEGLEANSSGQLSIRNDWLPAPLRQIFDKTSMMWDLSQARWDMFLLNYDLTAQRELLESLGISFSPKLFLTFGSVLILIFGLSGYWFYQRKRRENLNPSQRLFHQFSEKLRKLGIERDSSEGPAHFRDRIFGRLESKDLPQKTKLTPELTKAFFELYFATRFGDQPLTPQDFKLWRQKLGQL